MKNSVFITATDTDAGKTWVTSHLIQSLLEQRKKAKAIKPIVCGLNAKHSYADIEVLLQTQGLKKASEINHTHFSLAAAPSIAAQAEGKKIDKKALLAWCSLQAQQTGLCLIEGIGGLMVPITPSYLVSDWLLDMPNTPVILIVGAKLGCINHALLSLSHLSSIGREPAWIIINNTDGKQETHLIKEALLPHTSNTSTILECGYNQKDSLIPLLTWLNKSFKELAKH